METTENVGIIFPEILIPEAKTNLKKWAVVACDQFTTNEDYWIKTGRIVGGAPSTLHIIIPELYIKGDDLEDRISHAKATMVSYIEDGVLVRLPKGLILVERETGYRTRVGLVLAIDLEKYDPDSSNKSLIRATEETVADRLPVRMKLRDGCVLECPHTMLLIDDVKNSVIGPVYEKRKDFARVYDTPLMQEGGNLRGWFIDDEEVMEGIVSSLEKLMAKTKGGMLFAVGDGNHSLACAKAIWEKHKAEMTEEQRETSPLRYALVELINLYDNGISMEPIHRVLFNVEPSGALRNLVSILNEMGTEARMMYTRGMKSPVRDGTQVIYFESKLSKGRIEIAKPQHGLLAITLSLALEKLLSEMPKAEIEYVHGEEEFHSLTNEHATLGFLMEPINKEDLFGLVTEYGVLPKKSFSLGMPEEKRYYYECRLLVEARTHQDEAEAEQQYEEPQEEPEDLRGEPEDVREEPEEDIKETAQPSQREQAYTEEPEEPEEDLRREPVEALGAESADMEPEDMQYEPEEDLPEEPERRRRGLFGRVKKAKEQIPQEEPEDLQEEPEEDPRYKRGRIQEPEEDEDSAPEEEDEDDGGIYFGGGRGPKRPKKERKGLFGRNKDWHDSL